MSEASLSTCSQCGSPIANEDLNGGLAVRVDGQLVCGNCVDTLPGEAVLRINRMRALRGLEVTTYLVPLASAPSLKLYSFTSSANITNHRRKLVSDGVFDAPKLPPPGQRVVIPAEPKPSRDVATAVNVMPKIILLAAAATLIIVIGLVFLVLSLRHSPPTTETLADHTLSTEAIAPAAEKTRFDYPVDPHEAWLQSAHDRDCPNQLRQVIAQELIRQRSRQLERAEQALAERQLDEATDLANALTLPDDFAFRSLQERVNDFQKRLSASRSLTTATPPTPTSTPTPTPVKPPTAPALPVPNPDQPIVVNTQVTEAPTPTPPTPNNSPPPPEPATPAPQPPVPEPAPVTVSSSTQVWHGEYITTNRDKKPYELLPDGSEFIPDGWPGGMSDLVRSSRSRTLKRHGLFLDLKKASIKDGGICLLVHPLRADRKSLSVSVTDAKGKTITFPLVQFATTTWTPIILPISADANIDATQIITLGLTDGDEATEIPEDSGFILSKTVLVTGHPPTLDDLGLRPTALVADDDRVRNFARALDIIAKSRKRSTYKRLLEIECTRIVLSSLWATHNDIRTELAGMLKNSSSVEAPQAALVPATFTDAWLDTMAKGRNAPLDPMQTHIAVWWTGGAEIKSWPDTEKALNDFWKRRINQLLEVGILPVIVIGPNSQTEEHRAAAEAMWQQLMAISPIRLYSLPVIDLRALTTAADGSMDAATQTLAITLIGDALNEINYMLRRQGAVK